MIYKIAIDGPAGSGKSSLSKVIAPDNNILSFSSGIFYRACAFILNGTDINDTQKIKFMHESHVLKLQDDFLIMDGEEMNQFLFTNEISSLASTYSTAPLGREHENNTLRSVAEGKSVILEGRDIGTVVFKDAE